jgi:CopG family nickel-responsive transcriptional regulator
VAGAESTIRFTVSLPGALLAELDRRAEAKGYPSRSELVRDLIREKMVEERWMDDSQEVVGVLTISYDHHQRELTNRILDIQHNQYVHILCSTHVHLDHHSCLETIILCGRPPEIERISNEIGALRGVRFAELTRASKVEV